MTRLNYLLFIVIVCFSNSVLCAVSLNFKNIAKSVYAAGQTTRNYLKSTIKQKEILHLASLDTVDYIRYFGYPCESHEIITRDKYKLTIHRIPYGRNITQSNNSTNCTKPVVFLQHGLFSYSGDWVLTGPDKALGFILADAGYDVWLGNARGNKHSRDHIRLDPNIDRSFWNFSWHEIGDYDLPAMIDYILDFTERKRLFYVGHSQGNTAYYVMLSEHPEYNDKIIAQYSLSPIAFVTNLVGQVKQLSYFERLLDFGVDFLQLYELKHDNAIFKYLFHKFCSTHFVKDLCIQEISSVVGRNPKQFNQTLLPIILANFPAGGSTKQMKHFAQEMRSGNFAKYDYGYNGNMIAYDEHFPPKYILGNIKAPIYLFCSGNDYLSSLKDVKKLYWSLPEGRKHLWKVEDEMWNHVDYIWGIDAKKLVYDKIMESMKTILKDNSCVL